MLSVDERQWFCSNLSKFTDLAGETFNKYEADTEELSRVMVKQEFNYYATGLMWMRIIDLKSKQGMMSLTSAEKDIRNETIDKEWNVPQTLHAYLTQMGHTTDKLEKKRR